MTVMSKRSGCSFCVIDNCLIILKRHRADVKWESVLFSFRLGVLATPDAVVSRPVAQLSIPINGKFELVRGM